jgi:hypothetical protein
MANNDNLATTALRRYPILESGSIYIYDCACPSGLDMPGSSK